MDNDKMPAGLGCNEGLGPLPEAGMTEANPYIGLGPLDPHKGAQILTWYSADQMHAYALSERDRIAALIAQHTGMTLDTLEYLETMRQGPTAKEWAELDARARA